MWLGIGHCKIEGSVQVSAFLLLNCFVCLCQCLEQKRTCWNCFLQLTQCFWTKITYCQEDPTLLKWWYLYFFPNYLIQKCFLVSFTPVTLHMCSDRSKIYTLTKNTEIFFFIFIDGPVLKVYLNILILEDCENITNENKHT